MIINRLRLKPSLPVALIPLGVIALLLGIGYGIYRIHPQILLVAAAFATAVLGLFLGLSWKDMEKGILDSIQRAMPAILIMLSVGILIGSWIVCGTIPMVIYYGLQIISPQYFLVASCLVCSLASLATGTSWGTIGTLGVAFMGIAQGLGIPPAQAAGAVISGAYFGDKMSPFSDVANLAPVAAGSNLFDHIRHMMWSATPAWLISLAIYFVIGLRYGDAPVDAEPVRIMTSTLRQNFRFNVLLLVPIVLVFYLALTKRPTIPSILISSAVAGILAAVFQKAAVVSIAQAMNSGFVPDTGIENVDRLLSRGGLNSMLDALMIAFAAFCFGGIMQRTGLLAVLLNRIKRFADQVWKLVFTTIGAALGTALITGNPYLAMLIPGELLAPAYQKAGLAAKNLSRLVEECGAILIPLIPWSMGGVFCAGVLGVSTLAYLPWAIMNYAAVAVLALYGVTGFTMAPRIRDDETQIGS
jgi:NhaC family Na+:H+ antiporter